MQIGVRGVERSLQEVVDDQVALMQWKPEIESVVSDLKNSVFDVTHKVALFIHQLPRKNLKMESGSSASFVSS